MSERETFRGVWAPRLISLVRILLDLLYMQHGLSKYFGFPAAAPQNFEVFSAFIVSGEMAVANFIIRHRWSVSFFPILNNGVLEAVYSLFFFTFFLVDGGAWSLDRLRKIPCREGGRSWCDHQRHAVPTPFHSQAG